MKHKPIPRKCKSCSHLWEDGFKDGKHDRWCTVRGKPSYASIGQCKNAKYENHNERTK